MSTRKELAKMAAKAAAIATYNSIMGVTKTAQSMSTPAPDEHNVPGIARALYAPNIAEVVGTDEPDPGVLAKAKGEKPGFLAKVSAKFGPDFANKVNVIITGKGI